MFSTVMKRLSCQMALFSTFHPSGDGSCYRRGVRDGAGIRWVVLLLLVLGIKISEAQWQMHSSPPGGYVRSFLYDGSCLYAATASGVLISMNHGTTWEFRNNGLKSCDTKSLASLGGYVFVATDGNVFRSNNQGQSWEPAGTALEGKYVKTLVVCNNALFAGTYLQGIYRSTDSGNTWTAVANGLNTKYIYWLETDGSYLYAGSFQNCIFRSTDMGNTWAPASNGFNASNVATIKYSQGKLFASSFSSDQGVYVSVNSGNSWSPLPTFIPSVKGFTEMNGVLYAASYGNGVYKSVNGGQTWVLCSDELDETDIWSIGNDGVNLYVGVGSGHIFKSSDEGVGWMLCNDGIIFRANVGGLAQSGTITVAATHGSGLYTSTNNGYSWTRVSGINTLEIRSLCARGSLVLAGTDLLGVYKSTNSGLNFYLSNTGLTSQWIQGFAFCQGKWFAATGEEGVFVSTDEGESWSAVNNGLGSLFITAIASDGTNLYVATQDAGVF